MKKGKFFVIEGADGTGKSTQFRLLRDRFEKEGFPIQTMKLPQYGKPSAAPVESYLKGAYGQDPQAVNPYAVSLFFTIDRFDAAQKIRSWLETGTIVLFDRYVDSNVGHQGGKIQNLHDRKKFLQWLYELEYGLLAIPRPDLVFILSMPFEQTTRLLKMRMESSHADIQDRDETHLMQTHDAYEWLATELPDDHKLIQCVQDDVLLSPDAIHQTIWDFIKPMLT